MPPTTATVTLLLLFLFTPTAFSSNRRTLHQPFFPTPTPTPGPDSNSSPPSPPPPSPSPSPPPSSTPNYPFTDSTADKPPFFQSYPSPPPPLPPPSSSALVSFPANITSLSLPHSSPPSPASKKLVIITVALSLSAALLASLAVFFFRSRPKPLSTLKTTTLSPIAPPPPPPPKLAKPSTNSSEFLYLGTLANSSTTTTGVRHVSGIRKLDSPELHPLPPLHGRHYHHSQHRHEEHDDDEEEFYSPSPRGFDAVARAQAEQLRSNNGGADDVNYDESTSSSSFSSGSPARSASISISPPVSNSPKDRSSNPKSSPEFMEMLSQPRMPLPEIPSSEYSLSSPEIAMETIKEEDEDEESPLLSSASTSSRMSSPPQSPPLSPLTGKLGKEREWRVLNRSSPPLSNSPLNSNVSDRKTPSPARLFNVAPPPPPPPRPPPPPAPLRKVQDPQPPRPPPPPLPPLTQLAVTSTPPKPVAGGNPAVEFMEPEPEPKPKLKPLHWDKVRASSDREMVWDQLRSSSFKLNEEMIEALFVVNASHNHNQKEMPRKPAPASAKSENRVLDPKKAQNIAILLRALNVTMEEVCDALLEGNAETLGPELLESLLKMAPTKEEERNLKEYKDDSPIKLGQAEKFLKAVIDIPFAFKRVEAMLYMANFESEVEYLKKSFESLAAACDELRSSRMFLKLLEAVLKTGNRMNVGTNRGDAQAFKLDTLLKLVDIKGADGKTTLLHFVVQEISRTEGQRLLPANNQPSNEDAKYWKLGLQVVSSLSSELANVKKAAAMDNEVLSNDVTKLTLGLAHIGEVVRLNDQTPSPENNRKFSESLIKFMKMGEQEIIKIQAQEKVAHSLVKEITEYFHGNSAKEEAHPFRIFMVVRDFLTIVDRVCKEVGLINGRTAVSSAHRFPVPLNPMLPVPMNPLLPQVLPQSSSSNED